MSNDIKVGTVETRWWCSYCNTFYAEYVNGCPRCHFGDPGTSTSVVAVEAIWTSEGWLLPVPASAGDGGNGK